MIVPDQDIDNFNLCGYHITTTDNLKRIRSEGLIPQCGERSKSIGDTREAVFFFPAILLINNWIKILYKAKDKESLELLKINIKRLDFIVTENSPNSLFGDWYTKSPIAPEKLELLRRFDPQGKPFFLEDILKQNSEKLVWTPIESTTDDDFEAPKRYFYTREQ